MWKKLFLIIVFLLITLTFPVKAFAQGTYSCSWLVLPVGSICSISKNGCSDGYRDDCGTHSNSIPGCNSQVDKTCLPENNNIQIKDVDYSNLLKQPGQPNITSIGNLISRILPYIFGVAGIALLLFLIIGGFQMMFSAGDPKAAQAAQSRITTALIGFIIIFVAYWLVLLLGRIFGISQLSSIFG